MQYPRIQILTIKGLLEGRERPEYFDQHIVKGSGGFQKSQAGEHSQKVTVALRVDRWRVSRGGRRVVKFTQYFLSMRSRPDRVIIELQWIAGVIQNPLKETIQEDGRIRRWGLIPEEGKYLRVILLPDGETVHNAFFDRGFSP